MPADPLTIYVPQNELDIKPGSYSLVKSVAQRPALAIAWTTTSDAKCRSTQEFLGMRTSPTKGLRANDCMRPSGVN